MSRWFDRVARSAAATGAAVALIFAPGAWAQYDTGTGETSPAPQESGNSEPTNSLEGSGGEEDLLGPTTGDALSELEALTGGGTEAGQSTGAEDLGVGPATEP